MGFPLTILTLEIGLYRLNFCSCGKINVLLEIGDLKAGYFRNIYIYLEIFIYDLLESSLFIHSTNVLLNDSCGQAQFSGC